MSWVRMNGQAYLQYEHAAANSDRLQRAVDALGWAMPPFDLLRWSKLFAIQDLLRHGAGCSFSWVHWLDAE
eukprot:1709138-Prymnesium_polylepis.1